MDLCGRAANSNASWQTLKSLEALRCRINCWMTFPGCQVYTDVEREGVPPKDVDRQSAAPHVVVEEEEDRASALLPTHS